MDTPFPFVTASQTVGPFYTIACHWEGANVLVNERTQGERILLRGRVLDGDGRGVPDAMIEIWQANGAGRYSSDADAQAKPLDPAFTGFGRAVPDGNGSFEFSTIRPGAVPGAGGALQAPHIAVSVFARGLLQRLVTRVYFPDAEPANAADAVLARVPPERRATLIARADPAQRGAYLWDVVLQGVHETVFFAC